MPEPKRGESRSSYVNRAVPMMMAEGLSQSQAVGKAEGMYDFYKKNRRKKK